MSAKARIFTIRCEATGDVEADMTDENPKTADTIWDALPIVGRADRWGDEIYFSTSIDLGEENPREEVAVGTVAYWPPGKALCIFFGATPVSQHGEPRAFSPVNVFAKILGDATVFRKVGSGDRVTIERP